MLLLVEFLIVAVLMLVLIALYVDEYRTRYQRVSVGRMAGYWNGEERRRYIRVDATLLVRYEIEKKPRLTASVLTKNIGTGGILIETSEKLPIETLLGLEIDVPDQRKPIIADGKVVWIKERPETDHAGKRMFNTGIKFVNMYSREKELLLQYIKGSSF